MGGRAPSRARADQNQARNAARRSAQAAGARRVGARRPARHGEEARARARFVARRPRRQVWSCRQSRVAHQTSSLRDRRAQFARQAESKRAGKADKARKAAEALNAELRGKLTGLEKSRLGVDNTIKRLEGELA